MQLYLNLRAEVFLLNVGLLAHAEQVERDLAPVLALMDGPGISHRLAALRACVWSDAQLRLAAHSRISRSPSPVISQRPVAVRPPVGAQHVQQAAAASATQKQVHATVPKPLLSRVPYYQQAVAIDLTMPGQGCACMGNRMLLLRALSALVAFLYMRGPAKTSLLCRLPLL